MNGYPEDPPVRLGAGIRNGLILAAGMWLFMFVVLLVAFRT